MSLTFEPVIFFSGVLKPKKFVADLSREIKINETCRADLMRQIGNETVLAPGIAHADLARGITFTEKFSAKTKRIVSKTEQAAADTCLQIAAFEKFSANLSRALREFARADTCRQATRVEKAVASTVVRVPHIWDYIVQPATLRTTKARLLADNNQVSIVNTFKDYGVTAINITLSEKTLSDNFTFEITRPININDAVQGTLLDYPFNFLVEETTQTELIQSVKGMYNQDELLYTQFFLPTAKIETKEASTADFDAGEVAIISASNHIRSIAAHLNLSADINFSDFTPYNLNGNNRITYADLLNSLFGWTSRLPQRQINVFIRGGTLHCIQRGMENSVFDITDLPHSRLTVNKKLIRSLWSNPKSNDNPNNDNPNIEYLYDENPTPFSGTISFFDEGVSTVLKYSKGLLVHEANEIENAKSTVSSATIYEYVEKFPSDMTEIRILLQKAMNKNFYGEFYLSKKKLRVTSETWSDNDHDNQYDNGELKKVEQTGTTIYRYGRTEGDDVYLSSEKEETTTTTAEANDYGVYETTDIKTDTRETFHVPIGNGWYGQSVYLNGEAQGSNVSQGKPGNKVSQYTIAEVQKTFKGYTITQELSENSEDDNEEENSESDNEDYDDWRRKLSPIADTSFPVRELDLLKQFTSDLLWLNRKTQETVTVDLIPKVENGVPSINHIVDFTERVRLDGAEYFLVSNRITFTPRKFIQKLQLIRWY